jgi:hypothetical protein
MATPNRTVVDQLRKRLLHTFNHCAKAMNARTPEGLEFVDAISAMSEFMAIVVVDMEQRIGRPEAIQSRVVRKAAIDLLIRGLKMADVFVSQETVRDELLLVRRGVAMAEQRETAPTYILELREVLATLDRIINANEIPLEERIEAARPAQG